MFGNVTRSNHFAMFARRHPICEACFRLMNEVCIAGEVDRRSGGFIHLLRTATKKRGREG